MLNVITFMAGKSFLPRKFPAIWYVPNRRYVPIYEVTPTSIYVTTPTKYLAHSHIGWCMPCVKNDHKMASVPSSDHNGSIFLLESDICGHRRMALELIHPMCFEDL